MYTNLKTEPEYLGQGLVVTIMTIFMFLLANNVLLFRTLVNKESSNIKDVRDRNEDAEGLGRKQMYKRKSRNCTD